MRLAQEPLDPNDAPESIITENNNLTFFVFPAKNVLWNGFTAECQVTEGQFSENQIKNHSDDSLMWLLSGKLSARHFLLTSN